MKISYKKVLNENLRIKYKLRKISAQSIRIIIKMYELNTNKLRKIPVKLTIIRILNIKDHRPKISSSSPLSLSMTRKERQLFFKAFQYRINLIECIINILLVFGTRNDYLKKAIFQYIDNFLKSYDHPEMSQTLGSSMPVTRKAIL